EKIDRIGKPHRVGVIAARPGQGFSRVIGEIHQANRMGAAATIVTPLTSLILRPGWKHRDRNLFVSKAAAVRRECTSVSTRRRQGLGDTALDVDAPEAEMGMRYRITVGREDDTATIWSPPAHHIKTRMISQAPGFAAGSGDHINIRVAGYGAGEGYQ